MLIWLKAGAWREGVSALFKAIRMELQSLQPQDSSTIKWSKTPSGMTAHVVDTPVGAGGVKRIAPTEEAVVGGGDASYKGYFKIVDVSDDDGVKVKVIDGALGDPEEAETAGDAQINDVIYTDIAAVEIELAAGWNYIYLIAEFEETPTIESFSTKQEYVDGYSKTLIARVNYVDGAIKIVQEHFGMIYASIYGDCEE